MAMDIHLMPLSRAEQDDMFRQMEKWLADGGIRPSNMLACEVENVYRMRATIYQMRADIGGYETAGRAMAQELHAMQGLR